MVMRGLNDAFFLGESSFPVDLKAWDLLDEKTRRKVEEEGAVLDGKE